MPLSSAREWTGFCIYWIPALARFARSAGMTTGV